MPLSTYKNINPSEFDKQDKPIDSHQFDKQDKPTDSHGQDRTTLKDHNSNSIQQYRIMVIFGKCNNYWRFVFHVVETNGPILL